MPSRSAAALIHLCSSDCFLGCSKTLWQDWKNYYRIQNQRKAYQRRQTKKASSCAFETSLSSEVYCLSHEAEVQLPSCTLCTQLIYDHFRDRDHSTTMQISQALLLSTKNRYSTSLPGHAFRLPLAFLNSKWRKYLEGCVPQKSMETCWFLCRQAAPWTPRAEEHAVVSLCEIGGAGMVSCTRADVIQSTLENLPSMCCRAHNKNHFSITWNYPCPTTNRKV